MESDKKCRIFALIKINNMYTQSKLTSFLKEKKGYLKWSAYNIASRFGVSVNVATKSLKEASEELKAYRKELTDNAKKRKTHSSIKN